MIRTISIFYLLFFTLLSYSFSTDTTIIGKQTILFQITQEAETELGSSKSHVLVYVMDTNNEKHLALIHTLYDGWGDCNSETLELGGFNYTDSSITFYSFWCHMGDAPVSPWGARKETFTLTKRGWVKMENELYIEAGNPGWPETDGVEFLHVKPKSKKESMLFENYVHRMEKTYKANFVYGKRADTLVAEVKLKLKDLIKEHTDHWNSNVGFGYKL